MGAGVSQSGDGNRVKAGFDRRTRLFGLGVIPRASHGTTGRASRPASIRWTPSSPRRAVEREAGGMSTARLAATAVRQPPG
jgi:hypothetical protein